MNMQKYEICTKKYLFGLKWIFSFTNIPIFSIICTKFHSSFPGNFIPGRYRTQFSTLNRSSTFFIITFCFTDMKSLFRNATVRDISVTLVFSVLSCVPFEILKSPEVHKKCLTFTVQTVYVQFDTRSLSSHSSAERGKCLCAHFKPEGIFN